MSTEQVTFKTKFAAINLRLGGYFSPIPKKVSSPNISSDTNNGSNHKNKTKKLVLRPLPFYSSKK